ncbi:hypothetical protein N7539_008687 [Penicillium diatomitis]|uniref:Uncharacterized protein n=1 Tax=Penicillium diatomitis TaxID=2819901 RepID=A0A9X0BM61_9EURO|nr:uncharacterized protein N7539_008687 [Penicillium diatomitis]KAJ5472118.1 hypothetical protein N7539_008687 [Penicillium diatomitis]
MAEEAISGNNCFPAGNNTQQPYCETTDEQDISGSAPVTQGLSPPSSCQMPQYNQHGVTPNGDYNFFDPTFMNFPAAPSYQTSTTQPASSLPHQSQVRMKFIQESIIRGAAEEIYAMPSQAQIREKLLSDRGFSQVLSQVLAFYMADISGQVGVGDQGDQT